MNRHLIIGASHALFMARALGAVEARYGQASAGTAAIAQDEFDADWRLLLLTPRTPFLQFTRTEQGLQVAANEALMAEVRSYDAPPSKVLMLINGNEHNARFMMEHAVPFDFFHPAVPGYVPGRQIVPRATVEAVVAEALTATRLTIAHLSRVLGRAARYVVAPPPPIACEAQIRRQPEIFDVAHARIEQPRVRLKIYEVYLECLARIAAQNGAAFVGPPAAHRDAEGFLLERYWYQATHANPDYYRSTMAVHAGERRLASV